MRLALIGNMILAAAAALMTVVLLLPERGYRPPDETVTVPADPASIARGQHLVEAVAVCTVCHGDDLGGKLAFEDPFLGHGYTTNLTAGRGGIGKRYTVRDWVRSIRYGVRPTRTAIQFMPSDHYNTISDADLGAIIGYLIQAPPIDNERTRVELNPVARLLVGVGLFGEVNRTATINFARPRSKRPLDEGAYLTGIAGCTFCHGSQLEGGQGPEPGAPAAPSLRGTDPLRPITKTDFVRSLRFGIARDGHLIQPKHMPWLGYRNMTDPELISIWQHTRNEPDGLGPSASKQSYN